MRQLADQTGAVTLSRMYDPYGTLIQTVGTVQTSFGFASEYTDANGLINLRARYYSSETGRFLTKDSWQGDDTIPMSYNAWLYVDANPINKTDPSGHDPWECQYVDPSEQASCYNELTNPTGHFPVPPQQPTPTPQPIVPHNQEENTGNLGGPNSCGPTALCNALETLGLGNYAACINTMNNLVPQGNPYGYDINSGIQPSGLVKLMQAAYPDTNVFATQAASASAGIQILRALTSGPGYQVIVDYLSNNQNNPVPNGNPNASMYDTNPWNFAHFARVVGFTGGNIVLAQSINPQTNGNTLSASVSDFSQAWRLPEYRSRSAFPDGSKVEKVSYWMLIIAAKGYQ